MMNNACRVFAPGNYSEIPRRIQIGPFNVFEFRTRGSLDVGIHAHATTTLGYVLDGSAGKHYKDGGFSYCVKPGEVELEPAHLAHSDPIGPSGLHGIVIELGPATFEKWPELVSRLHGPQHLPTGPICVLYRKMIAELAYEDSASVLAVEGLILEMLATFLRAGSERAPGDVPSWVGRAREFLDSGFLASIQLADLSREFDLHPAHLARGFRRHVGLTVGEYVRRLRIEHGKRLLLETSKPLIEIALELGFSDQSHFGHVFRRSVGCTPSQYRRLGRPSHG